MRQTVLLSAKKNLDDLKGEEMSGPPARNSLWKRHVKKSTFFQTLACTFVDCSQKLSEKSLFGIVTITIAV